MGDTALITGAAPPAAEVAEALGGMGYDVTVVEDPAAVTGSEVAPGALRCYVQLPVRPRHEEGNAVEQVKAFLFHGLLARFDAMSRLLPALAPGARVVLVGGNQPGDRVPDDPGARSGLLQVLGAAVAADRASEGVQVSVLSHGEPPVTVAEVAAGRRRGVDHVPLADLGPDLDYADWRLEVLSMVSRRR